MSDKKSKVPKPEKKGAPKPATKATKVAAKKEVVPETFVDPSCSECSTRNCYRRDSRYPNFCLSEANQDGAAETKALYSGQSLDAKVARAAAEVEAEYYGRLTRLEETIIFALKLGAKKLGVASCVGFLDESTVYAKVARAAGLEVKTVGCKVGSIDKCEIGLPDHLKLSPGQQESCCNPALQAKVLNDWGADVNVSIGLCVGHDYLFTKHSQAPAVTLAVKDRVLGHNPMAAIYTHKFYYKRIMSLATFPKSRLEDQK
ncbi:MAG: DUF1847 domain-containing protein [Deltaproteobacteria bacterium]|jgi:uncharacterized metal-binding protein|nr:DUF1847 domain-containing protein [Deltaproteobacteria bacterium]